MFFSNLFRQATQVYREAVGRKHATEQRMCKFEYKNYPMIKTQSVVGNHVFVYIVSPEKSITTCVYGTTLTVYKL